MGGFLISQGVWGCLGCGCFFVFVGSRNNPDLHCFLSENIADLGNNFAVPRVNFCVPRWLPGGFPFSFEFVRSCPDSDTFAHSGPCFFFFFIVFLCLSKIRRN